MRKNNKKKKMYLYRTAKTHLHAGEEVNTRALEADELGGEQKKRKNGENQKEKMKIDNYSFKTVKDLDDLQTITVNT